MSTVEGEDSEWDIRTTCTSISIHPLELSDKIAYESIKTVKMKWIMEQAKSPIPRYQDLPSSFLNCNARYMYPVSTQFRAGMKTNGITIDHGAFRNAR